MPIELSDELTARAKSAIREYGEARMAFRQIQDELKDTRILVGNDNKVGVAGEFWAMLLYEQRGFVLEEIPQHNNNPDFDFVVSDQVGGRLKISVKSITAENKRGVTTQVKANGDWDELCLVLMDNVLHPEAFGICTKADFRSALVGNSQKRPASRNWLGAKWMQTHQLT